MNITKEEADSLKLTVRRLFKEIDGQLLIEFLEQTSGKYAPTYNPESATSIAIEAGKREVLATLRNINRLTSEQIVEYYNPKGIL